LQPEQPVYWAVDLVDKCSEETLWWCLQQGVRHSSYTVSSIATITRTDYDISKLRLPITEIEQRKIPLRLRYFHFQSQKQVIKLFRATK